MWKLTDNQGMRTAYLSFVVVFVLAFTAYAAEDIHARYAQERLLFLDVQAPDGQFVQNNLPEAETRSAIKKAFIRGYNKNSAALLRLEYIAHRAESRIREDANTNEDLTRKLASVELDLRDARSARDAMLKHFEQVFGAEDAAQAYRDIRMNDENMMLLKMKNAHRGLVELAALFGAKDI